MQKATHYFDELSGNENVICDLPEIFPQKKLPVNYQFIGPLFHANNRNGDVVLERIDSLKKTILLTMGSSKEWERFNFLNKEEFSQYNVIVVGEKNHVMNAFFLLKTPFVNFEEVLPKVDLVICHGGNGTIYQALHNKVPVLCYPSHLEQTWNVHRIDELGYGQSLEKINSRKFPAIIKNWIERKPNIQWSLNFDAFNNTAQDKLLLEIVAKNVKTSELNFQYLFVN